MSINSQQSTSSNKLDLDYNDSHLLKSAEETLLNTMEHSNIFGSDVLVKKYDARSLESPCSIGSSNSMNESHPLTPPATPYTSSLYGSIMRASPSCQARTSSHNLASPQRDAYQKLQVSSSPTTDYVSRNDYNTYAPTNYTTQKTATDAYRYYAHQFYHPAHHHYSSHFTASTSSIYAPPPPPPPSSSSSSSATGTLLNVTSNYINPIVDTDIDPKEMDQYLDVHQQYNNNRKMAIHAYKSPSTSDETILELNPVISINEQHSSATNATPSNNLVVHKSSFSPTNTISHSNNNNNNTNSSSTDDIYYHHHPQHPHNDHHLPSYQYTINNWTNYSNQTS